MYIQLVIGCEDDWLPASRRLATPYVGGGKSTGGSFSVADMHWFHVFSQHQTTVSERESLSVLSTGYDFGHIFSPSFPRLICRISEVTQV